MLVTLTNAEATPSASSAPSESALRLTLGPPLLPPSGVDGRQILRRRSPAPPPHSGHEVPHGEEGGHQEGAPAVHSRKSHFILLGGRVGEGKQGHASGGIIFRSDAAAAARVVVVVVVSSAEANARATVAAAARPPVPQRRRRAIPSSLSAF